MKLDFGTSFVYNVVETIKKLSPKAWIFLIILVFMIVAGFSIKFFGKTPLERNIEEAIRQNDFIQLAIYCSRYEGDKYQKECSEGLLKAEEEIDRIISTRQDFPFMKLILEKEKSVKIEELLRENIHLSVKYRSIWYGTAELLTE